MLESTLAPLLMTCRKKISALAKCCCSKLSSQQADNQFSPMSSSFLSSSMLLEISLLLYKRRASHELGEFAIGADYRLSTKAGTWQKRKKKKKDLFLFFRTWVWKHHQEYLPYHWKKIQDTDILSSYMQFYNVLVFTNFSISTSMPPNPIIQ